MKVQITQVTVKNIVYKGNVHPCLNINYQYTAVIIQGFSDEGSLVRVNFMNTGCSQMIYDDFVAFAEDWEIVGDYKFKECFLPIKSK